MKKTSDSIVENFIFDYILRRNSTQQLLLWLYDSINAEKIQDDYKEELMYALIGKKLISSKDEIQTMIDEFRAGNTIPKIYEILLSFIEEYINIEDSLSMKYLLKETKFELEAMVNDISLEIISDFTFKMQEVLKTKKTFLERFQKNFLDEEEKNEVISEIANYTFELSEEQQHNLKRLNEMILENIKNQELWEK